MANAIDFLKGYQGNNNFLHSLKQQYLNKGYLSPKQTACLELAFEKERNKAPETNNTTKEETETMATKTKIPAPTDFFELELDSPEPAGETPATDHVQVMLEKMFSTTLAHWSAKLETEAAKVRTVLNQQPILKIRLGDGAPVRQLKTEAHPLLPEVLLCAKLGENPLLVGPAGCGKSTLGEQVADAMGLAFGHLCFSAGASETWLTARQLATGLREAQFSKFYRNGGVFLLDEIDAADPNVLMTINTALANHKLMNEILGEEIPRHKDFVCIAAANTFGLGGNGQYTARNRLDAATLDRFAVFELDYQDKIERQVCPDKALREKLQKARQKLRERNAQQVVSTRTLGRIHKLVTAGMSEERATRTLTASWPKGLAAEVGLADAPAF